MVWYNKLLSEILPNCRGNLAFIFGVGSVNLKKIVTNPKWRKYWFILVAIFIVGLIGFLVPYGDARWNFLFENMIWLPVELFLTVFAVNKILELIEEDRNRQRFIRLTRKANEHLVDTIKKNVVSIPINCQVYDKDRNENQLYDKIIENPSAYFTEELFYSTRSYAYVSYEKNYNYLGIKMVHCEKIDTEIKKYIERYEPYLDDDLFNQLNIVEQKNYSFGVLNFKTDIGKIGGLSIGGIETLEKGAQEFLKEINNLVILLESYKE